MYPVYSCGRCVAWAEGRPNVCRTIGFHGLTSHGGGMAEFTTVPADFLHTLPESVDLRMGALVDPMAVAWRAVALSGIEARRRAFVAGAGPIGFGVWFALQARGVDSVIVPEPSESRRAAAERLGIRVVEPDVAGSRRNRVTVAARNIAVRTVMRAQSSGELMPLTSAQRAT